MIRKETLITRRRQLCQDMGRMAWPKCTANARQMHGKCTANASLRKRFTLKEPCDPEGQSQPGRDEARAARDEIMAIDEEIGCHDPR